MNMCNPLVCFTVCIYTFSFSFSLLSRSYAHAHTHTHSAWIVFTFYILSSHWIQFIQCLAWQTNFLPSKSDASAYNKLFTIYTQPHAHIHTHIDNTVDFQCINMLLLLAGKLWKIRILLLFMMPTDLCWLTLGGTWGAWQWHRFPMIFQLLI